MQTLDTTARIEPERWNVVFSTKVTKWWVSLLAWGRFKHVWAFAYVSSRDCWLLYDVHMEGTRIAVIPDTLTNRAWMIEQIRDCEIIVMPRRKSSGVQFGFWCVTAVRHLVGVRCHALRPDALWRSCLRNGGEIISATEGARAQA